MYQVQLVLRFQHSRPKLYQAGESVKSQLIQASLLYIVILLAHLVLRGVTGSFIHPPSTIHQLSDIAEPEQTDFDRQRSSRCKAHPRRKLRSGEWGFAEVIYGCMSALEK